VKLLQIKERTQSPHCIQFIDYPIIDDMQSELLTTTSNKQQTKYTESVTLNYNSSRNYIFLKTKKLDSFETSGTRLPSDVMSHLQKKGTLTHSQVSEPQTSHIYTRWFKYDRDDLCVNKSQFVPVISEPPCIN
jgi:hypothetical protein